MGERTEVGIAIPTDMIRGLVAAEIAKALGDPTQVVESVVRAALAAECRCAKCKNSYRDKLTGFECQTRGALEAVAVEAVREWVAREAPKVKEAIVRELEKNKQRRLRTFAATMLDGIEDRLAVHISCEVKRKPGEY